MIAVSEEMKNEDLKDPSNMEQEASEETASENTETSAEEKTTEKAPEKEGFFKKKKDPKDEKIEELTDRVKRHLVHGAVVAAHASGLDDPARHGGDGEVACP